MANLKEVVKAEEVAIDIEPGTDILEANRKLALKNRELLRKYNVQAIDVMGSIGAGKTSLIEKLVELLKKKYRIAVFKGDLTTTIDAERIGSHGVQVVPINTGRECHLDANLVAKAVQKINLENIDLLFIENVGNLVCPVAFDLAVSGKAAAVKRFGDPGAGDADILLVPTIEVGNALFKMMVYFMGACAAGIVVGLKIPLVLTSRADPVAARIASIALAVKVKNEVSDS